MPKWPANLEEKQKMTFGINEMPNQAQDLINYISANTNSKPIDVIILPLPPQMEDTMTHTWDKSKGLVAAGTTTVVDLAKGAGSRFHLDGVIDSAQNKYGAIPDPNFFYAYQGSDPRSFSYSINMIPNNAEEAALISKIIFMFKKYSSPKKGKAVKNFAWKITVANKKISNLLNFSVNPWALTSVTTNYTGAGSSLFFEDGNPKQINLSLTFQEIATVYSEQWKE